MADQPHVDADRPALASLGEWIVGVGDLGDLRRRMPEAELVDFGDATIVPGFNDAHQHPTMMAANQRGVDVSAAISHVALLDELRGGARDTLPGQWVLGTRYDHGKSTGGKPLTRADLDEVTYTHPVLLINIGESAAPPGGGLTRDAAGHLNGVVHEQSLFELAYPSLSYGRLVFPVQDGETALAQLKSTLRELNAAGITSVGDAMVDPAELTLLQEAHQRGELTALLTYRHVDTFHAAGLRTGFGDHWLRIGGVKAFADGAVAGGTRLVEEPFYGTDDHGIQTLRTDELNDLPLRVHAAGSRLSIHVNGDRAIKLVLDSLERARAAHPVIRTAHRLEHCSMVDTEILARMKALDAIALRSVAMLRSTVTSSSTTTARTGWSGCTPIEACWMRAFQWRVERFPLWSLRTSPVASPKPSRPGGL
nr:amidohydrolase family protein [Saccharopolyspora sp. ASAGF58]